MDKVSKVDTVEGSQWGRVFTQDGFLKVEGLFSNDEVAAFKKQIGRILEAVRRIAATTPGAGPRIFFR